MAGLTVISPQFRLFRTYYVKIYDWLTGAAPSGLGDLTQSEANQIQSVVNQAGRPIEVVGSAARGTRTAGSDIDYVAPPSSIPYFKPYQSDLPGIDPTHGIIPGVGNPNIGPIIRFTPQ